MPQTETPLIVSGLQKSYGGCCVLDIAELCLPTGALCALIGPNGCGKSTLLRLLAGTLVADGGPIRFSEPLKGEDIAYMPQKTYTFRFSLLKNVLLALEGFEATEARRRALAALGQVGLAELARRRADTLSGGEAQRMAFARMIVRPRKLLLLDEPTSSTDIVGNDLVEGALRNFAAHSGCTVLFSTHSPAQALRLADYAFALHEGRLAEQGPARQLLTAPQNEDVAQFLRHWRLG